jgi:hypothetical protein
MFNEDWRIRQSSIALLGDMLYKIGGTKALAGIDENDDDEGEGSAQVGYAILKALGPERRNEVFGALYMIRSDTSAVVRQSALQVWKSVVSNTPRTLREILPQLMEKILDGLSSSDGEQRIVSGRCLGDIVRKLGERIMPEVVPILQEGLKEARGSEELWGKRQGVCIGLSEVISCATHNQLEDYLDGLLSCVQEVRTCNIDECLSLRMFIYCRLCPTPTRPSAKRLHKLSTTCKRVWATLLSIRSCRT